MDSTSLNAGRRQPGPDARDQRDSPCILEDQKEEVSFAESWGRGGGVAGREVGAPRSRAPALTSSSQQALGCGLGQDSSWTRRSARPRSFTVSHLERYHYCSVDEDSTQRPQTDSALQGRSPF